MGLVEYMRSLLTTVLYVWVDLFSESPSIYPMHNVRLPVECDAGPIRRSAI
jgi:hypothetical protein